MPMLMVLKFIVRILPSKKIKARYSTMSLSKPVYRIIMMDNRGRAAIIQ